MLAQQLASGAAELRLVLGKAPARFNDKGGGLLEGQRQVTQFLRKLPGGCIVAGMVAFPGDAILELTGSILRGQ